MTTRSRKKKEKSEDEEKTEDIGETNFVKSLKFRKNRGNRIQALLNGEGDYDNDAFWSNNKYFGSFHDIMYDSEESEDYSAEASLSDVFDEDFEETDKDSCYDGDVEEKPKKTRKPRTSKKRGSNKGPASLKNFIDDDDGKSKKSKVQLVTTTTTTTASDGSNVVKRKRGRPRKIQEPVKKVKDVTVVTVVTEETEMMINQEEAPSNSEDPTVQEAVFRCDTVTIKGLPIIEDSSPKEDFDLLICHETEIKHLPDVEDTSTKNESQIKLDDIKIDQSIDV